MNGINWYTDNVPHLIAHGKGLPTTLVLMTSPRNALWFDRVGSTGNYAARFAQKSTIVYDSSTEEYIVTDEFGNKTLFFAFTIPSKGGMFKGLLNANGLPSLVSYDSLHRITSIETSSEGKSGGFYYKFSPGQKSPGKLESVTLIVNGVSIRRASYSYYGTGDANGLAWNLKTVIVEQYDPTGAVWSTLRTSYYRYHTANSEVGYNHGLKYAVGPDAYARMEASGIAPETATDEELEKFADYYFEYDWKRRVILERVNGGARTYAFQYEYNPAPGKGFNAWVTKTTETLPDGTQNIAYANAFAQVIAKIHRSGDRQWGKHFQFDNKGRQLLAANPSAIAGYDESTPSVANLHPNKGLVHTFEFYPENDQGGQPYGYLRYEPVQEGSNGKPVLLNEYRYAAHSVGYDTIYPMSKKIAYQSESGDLSPSVTQYTYDHWYQIDGIDTFQMQQRTTILPSIPTEQNGSGAASTFTEVFDQYGRRTWLKDARGFLTATTNDPVTGALITQIQDVNTALLPALNGWTTSAGGGLHLITDFEFDHLGRQTQSLGPLHELDLNGVLTSIRRAKWTVHIDDKMQMWEASGYATGVAPNYSFTLINPVTITSRDHRDRLIGIIAAARERSTGALSPEDHFPQSSYTRWQRIFFDPQSRRVSEIAYFAIPDSGPGSPGINYLETTYGYNARAKRNRISEPSGTIRRMVRDERGFVISNWIGTDDTEATSNDPTGGGTLGNNMKCVSIQEYDDGTTGGDGIISKVSKPIDDANANDRETTYEYDYRNRRVITTTRDGAAFLITKIIYDNQNRRLQSTRYKNSIADSNRVSQSRIFYDVNGRIYRQDRDGVDPNNGTTTNTLSSTKSYDPGGNVVTETNEGSTSFIKREFDALNRPIVEYIACVPGNAEVSVHGDDISSATVMEQNEASYDPAGNLILAVRRQRFDDAVGMGTLRDTNTQPKARVTYLASWPDEIGRLKNKADYGTNRAAEFVRPELAPTRSDKILITTHLYKNNGDANATIDPLGLETRWENDNIGRRIRLIENLGNGASGSSRITEYKWHSSGQLDTLTLLNNDTGAQITRWKYGTTLSESGIADNNVLRAKYYPESDSAKLEYTRNRQGEIVTFTDVDGTVHKYTYDQLGRLTDDAVTNLGPDLDNAILRISRTYEARGMSATVTSYDAPEGGNVINQVALTYDEFGNLTADRQSHSGVVGTKTPQVGYSYTDGSANTMRRTAITYPNGQVLHAEYGDANSIDDHLSRVTALTLSGSGTRLVEYDYVGVAWQVRVGYPRPEVELTYKRHGTEPVGDAGDQYTGYDRFGRTTEMRWQKATPGNEHIERILYTFDQGSRRTSRKRALATGEDYEYEYDGLSQINSAALGSIDGRSAQADIVSMQKEEWDYDPTGNWKNYKIAEDGQVILDQHRAHDKGNRLTEIENAAHPVLLDGAGRTKQVSPDSQGAWSRSQQMIWDAWSRITTIKQVGDGGVVVGKYSYDGLMRRTTRTVGDSTTHSYYSISWRVLEERNGADATAASQYYWGARHRDDLVRRDRATTGDGALTESRYVLMDYYNPAAIIDSTGRVSERYRFSAFGVRKILNPSDSNLERASECAFEFGFQGQFLDLESGFVNRGYRYYSPYLGRWLSKDPIGERGGNNLYAFCANAPTIFTDPVGRDFIALGSNPAIHLGVDVPGIGHLSLSHWYDTTYCISEGNVKNTTALVSQTDWTTAGGIPVNNNAQIQHVTQLDIVIFYTTQTVLGVTVAVPVPISVVVRSNSGNADHYVVVSADTKDNVDIAPNEWSSIESTADGYGYAEHTTDPPPWGYLATNWPNSEYSATGNNSNTFAKTLLGVIGATVPGGFAGRTYPGNASPVPVTDTRPTPSYVP